MTGPPTGAPVQLLVYRFEPGASFDGAVVGALERLEAGGSIRVLDALFVRSHPETGDIEVLQAGGDGIGSMLVSLLDFRLDPGARRRATGRAMDDATGGITAAQIRELADALAPGAALVAVLVDHVWTRTLDDAIERTGGVALLSRFVDAVALADVADDVEATARGD
jgi:hypothetical protein